MDFLTQEQIDTLKKEYGKLYKVPICGTDYIIRPVYKADWEIVTKLAADNPSVGMPELDEKLVDIALIGPKPDVTKGGWAIVPAGVIPTLSKWIQAKSGFLVPDLAGQQEISSEPIGGDAVSIYGKPSDEDVATAKTQSSLKLNLVRIDDDYYIIRPLLRQEWRAIMKSAPEDSGERDYLIAQRSVVWPKKVNWDETPAGYCSSITGAVMNISGYSGVTSVEEL